MNNEYQYDDIINLPHHTSETRSRMSMTNRAAQFSPFAALTGYDDAVVETARLTDERHELTEDEKDLLNERLQILSENAHDRPMVEITYFKPDDRKDGGSYEKVRGAVRWIDEGEMKVVFANGTRITIGNICSIEGELFKSKF